MFVFYWFERERERERDQLVASYMLPDWIWNVQPYFVPWLGIEPVICWCLRWYSNQLSHQAKGIYSLFFPFFYWCLNTVILYISAVVVLKHLHFKLISIKLQYNNLVTVKALIYSLTLEIKKKNKIKIFKWLFIYQIY